MAGPYIPAPDADLDVWADNFQTVIAANPALYGLVVGDATAITAAFTAWHAAYLLAVNPATRTPPAVADKDVQKATALTVWRGYAQVIQNNAGVTNFDKAAAGLTVRATGRTPIPAPATIPVLGFLNATPLQHTLNFKDAATPTTKAKPFGAINMQIFRFVGTVPPTGVDQYAQYGFATKSPFVIDFNSPDVGKTAYYIARWVTRRGLVGPWSVDISATVLG